MMIFPGFADQWSRLCRLEYRESTDSEKKWLYFASHHARMTTSGIDSKKCLLDSFIDNKYVPINVITRCGFVIMGTLVTVVSMRPTRGSRSYGNKIKNKWRSIRPYLVWPVPRTWHRLATRQWTRRRASAVTMPKRVNFPGKCRYKSVSHIFQSTVN